MVLIPFGPWEPDTPAINTGSPTLLSCENALPITRGAYGPIPSLSKFIGPLPDHLRGAAFGVTVEAQPFNVASTGGAGTGKLWLRTSGDFTDVSRLSGGAYTTAVTSNFEFVTAGKWLIGANHDDLLQYYDLSATGHFIDATDPNAPKARHCGVVKYHLMVGDCDTTAGSVYGAGSWPARVWWPDISDPTSWPVAGTEAALGAESDFQDLPYTGRVQRVAGVMDFGLVFMDQTVVRADYVGGAPMFSFSAISRNRGTSIPGSVCVSGPVCIFHSDDGWWQTTGVAPEPIGLEKVNRFFRNDLDWSNVHRVSSIALPNAPIFAIAYPGPGNVGGHPNRILFYHWQLRQWALASVTVEWLTQAYGGSISMDAYPAPANRMDGPGGGTAPFDGTHNMDSAFFSGLPMVLAGFDSQHRLGTFTGQSMVAILETSDVQLVPGQRAMVRTVRVLGDTRNVIAFVSGRARQYDPVDYSAGGTATRSGSCPVRANGRYVRTKVEGFQFNTLQGVEYEFIQGGRI